ncbi:MAG: peptidase M15 [Alphaproteobacteria bacterium]
MRKPQSVAALTDLGRARLSEHFFMREMLYSEVANFHGMPNIPDDPDLAIAAGEKLCRLVLEPMRRGLGHITIRSAYRSPSVNGFCNERLKAGDLAYFCGENDFNRARHIWDQRDAAGFLGATVSLVVPGYLAHYERTGDYRALGWWIRDHIEHYAEVAFYPWQCAFNIRWYEGPSDQSISHWSEGTRTLLTNAAMTNFPGGHADAYRSIIP